LSFKQNKRKANEVTLISVRSDELLCVAKGCANQFDETGRDAQKDPHEIQPRGIQPAVERGAD
jgi:hypothetical protein